MNDPRRCRHTAPHARLLALVTLCAATPAARAAPPPATTPAEAPAPDYARRVMELEQTFKGLRGRFVTGVEPPFVLVGDTGRGDLEHHARLIRWAVAELKRHFFAKDPVHIVTIWLFGTRASYLTNTQKLVGELPGTPFGFYSSQHRALIMNISTGGGTLVHELVHPFIEANVPGCPPWLNEGMGSLYEGVGRRNHRIWGYLNWRLPGLQRAIRRGALPSFRELMRQDETRFYDEDPGTNYGQARYLLYYLQDRGLLTTYYHAFVKNRRQDPTGLETLKRVLDIEDVDAFQRRWATYVLALKLTRPPVK